MFYLLPNTKEKKNNNNECLRRAPYFIKIDCVLVYLYLHVSTQIIIIDNDKRNANCNL